MCGENDDDRIGSAAGCPTGAAQAGGSGAAAVSRLDSVERMRVLAHPTRALILGALRVRGDMTVGQLSEVVGEAAGSVSYHLGKLEKGGLVRRVPSPDGDGRKSCWQAVAPVTEFGDVSDGDDLESENMMLHTFGMMASRMLDRFLEARHAMSDEWTDAFDLSDTVIRMTPADLDALGAEIGEVVARWKSRCDAEHHEGDGSENVSVSWMLYRLVL